MASSSSNVNNGMSYFWDSLSQGISQLSDDSSESSSTSSSLFSRFFGSSSSSSESCTQSVRESCTTLAKGARWTIENRGGLALAAGLMIVPSQFMCPGEVESMRILRSMCEPDFFGRVRAEIRTVTDRDIQLRYMIYYPPGTENAPADRCVLYHNPNGITAAGYFETGEIGYTPAAIAALKRCPMVIYDYRGTGMSQDTEPNSSCSSAFKPTYQTVADDGKLMLQEALRLYQRVDIWGSSLGGGVATVSTAAHLREYPLDAERVSLVNHDSFTTTPEVVAPKGGSLIRSVGHAVGGCIDAKEAMFELADRGIPITILCHTQDPVIPAGARMAEVFARLAPPQVRVVLSDEYGHANLSSDMIKELKQDRRNEE